MKKLALYALAAFALLIAPACSSHHGHDEHDHHSAHDHHASLSHQGEEHADESDEITLEPEMAERFGVECDTVRRAPFAEVIHASGRILATGSEMAVVAAPTSGIVNYSRSASPGADVARGALIATVKAGTTTGGNPNLAAKAALDAASRELERIKPLYAERLVTAAEYNSALAAYDAARASYSASAASGSATAPIAGVILSLDAPEGSYVEVGAPIATLASDRNLTFRIDVPRNCAQRLASFTDARVSRPDGSMVLLSSLGAKRVGATPGASAGNVASAYLPVFFSVPNRDGLFLAGSGLEAWLLGSPRPDVISVPAGALSEQMGEYFVYERLDEECYRKLPVRIGASDGERVEVLHGLNPGTVIVSKGATTLRLSENSKAIPEGHTHNH
ncbi:MAG: efflux RND transporter periplasmic adaptor subunit [Muribaculaceae bacterium]|nr:efflux RND transporter periplasmic adaptor subunit [Muribaculaceae bacterium]